MKFLAIVLILALILSQFVTVKRPASGDGYTDEQRGAFNRLHESVTGNSEPFGDMQEAADIWNVTPENINSYEEWW